MIVMLTASLYILYSTKTKTNKKVIIGFAGDTMLGRLVNKKIGQAGYTYPLGDLIPLLGKTDLNIVNLETTLTNSNKKIPKVFNFKAKPDRVKTLKAGHIAVVCLANNHIKDFGNEGLYETIDTLKKAGIKYVGAGNTIQEAKRPALFEKNGIKIGVLGYTDNEGGWKAGPSSPGTNYISVGDIDTVKKDIEQVRDKVDILIATIHWGPNMRTHPSPKFITFAHQMIDAGIDIIHGHSAHIFQGVQNYKNGLIMYDTGDFIDDYRIDPVLRNDRSFFFLVTVDKTGVKQLKLIPLLISGMQVNIAKNIDSTQSLKQMQKLSKELGTNISDDGIVKIVH